MSWIQRLFKRTKKPDLARVLVIDSGEVRARVDWRDAVESTFAGFKPTFSWRDYWRQCDEKANRVCEREWGQIHFEHYDEGPAA